MLPLGPELVPDTVRGGGIATVDRGGGQQYLAHQRLARRQVTQGLVVRLVKDLRTGARAFAAGSWSPPIGRLRRGRMAACLEIGMNQSYKAREA
jgi:hypothetical protein